jgi:predicted DNA-binding protein (MmcQ/YjbR family)
MLPKKTVVDQLRAFGLTYPGAHLKSPWPGHLDLAVNDKTFAYLSVPGEPASMSCKLPHSRAMALMLPFATPTGYGLGKSGWVTLQLARVDRAQLATLQAWVDESYRAQAPKKLVGQLGPRAAGTTSARPRRRSPRPVPPKRKR